MGKLLPAHLDQLMVRLIWLDRLGQPSVRRAPEGNSRQLKLSNEPPCPTGLVEDSYDVISDIPSDIFSASQPGWLSYPGGL
jgi:hypothetical protein